MMYIYIKNILVHRQSCWFIYLNN